MAYLEDDSTVGRVEDPSRVLQPLPNRQCTRDTCCHLACDQGSRYACGHPGLEALLCCGRALSQELNDLVRHLALSGSNAGAFRQHKPGDVSFGHILRLPSLQDVNEHVVNASVRTDGAIGVPESMTLRRQVVAVRSVVAVSENEILAALGLPKVAGALEDASNRRAHDDPNDVL